jgi:hypothetical protein
LPSEGNSLAGFVCKQTSTFPSGPGAIETGPRDDALAALLFPVFLPTINAHTTAEEMATMASTSRVLGDKLVFIVK